MSHIIPIAPDQAEGAIAEQFMAIQKMLGFVPNMMRTMAQSPAVLSGYLAFSGALAKGPLTSGLREKIALATAEANQCDYCLAAHTALAKGLHVTEEQSLAARRGQSADPKEAAILTFAQLISKQGGKVAESDWNKLRAAGVSDSEAAAIIAEVALNVLTNYFNNAISPVLDFPAAPEIE